MKNVLATLVFIGCLNPIYLIAQSIATVKIIYTAEHVRDTLHPKVRYKEPFSLYIGDNQTVFLSRNKELIDSSFQVGLKAFQNGTAKVIDFYTPGPTTKEIIYTNFIKNQEFKVVSYNLTTYKIPMVMDKIKWTLLPDKKVILGYPCQKATCNFKGRTYKVWFTTKIVGNSGPWKLNGLPGTILEAFDTKNEVTFIASSIIINPPYYQISTPGNCITTTQKEVERMINANVNGGVVNSGGDIKITDVKIEGSSGTLPKREKLVINNPLEKGN